MRHWLYLLVAVLLSLPGTALADDFKKENKKWRAGVYYYDHDDDWRSLREHGRPVIIIEERSHHHPPLWMYRRCDLPPGLAKKYGCYEPRVVHVYPARPPRTRISIHADIR